ncbi:MAG TPA: hypothetical protein VIJ38_10035 [Acidobacteriaceae bacterium]
MSVTEGSLNPAADKGRMFLALGSLVVLGMLAWFTIDSSAVVHVQGFSSRYIGFEDRDVEVRWLPILFLGLFALRVVLAHMRARAEKKDLQ